MKQIKRSVFAVLIAAVILMFAAPAAAENVDYKLGTYQSAKMNNFYKFKAPGYGFVTLGVKGIKYDSYGSIFGSMKGSLLDAKYASPQIFSYSAYSAYSPASAKRNLYLNGFEKASGNKFAVQKGATYYFFMNNIYLGPNPNPNPQFRLTFTQYSPGTNKTSSKAKSLAKGQKVYIVDTPKQHFARWYKIKLTERQKITLYTIGDSDSNFTGKIYDAKLKHIKSETLDVDGTPAFRTASKQNPGVYYIRMIPNSDSGPELGHFYWN